jgi:hypothetical protein
VERVESNLKTIQKKVLGAMLILSDSDMNVKATFKEIAQVMGYQRAGGVISFALETLEMKNYISKTEKGTYKVLI